MIPKERQEGKRKEEEEGGRREKKTSKQKPVPLAECAQSPEKTRRQCPSKLPSTAQEHIITLLLFLTSCQLACEL